MIFVLILLLKLDQPGILLLLHVRRIQIPWRTGVTSDAAMHLIAVDLERQEQVPIGRLGINAELGEITKEALAGITGVMCDGVYSLLEQILQLFASQFGHVMVPLLDCTSKGAGSLMSTPPEWSVVNNYR